MHAQLGLAPGDAPDQAGCLHCLVMLTLLVVRCRGNLCQLIHLLQGTRLDSQRCNV